MGGYQLLRWRAPNCGPMAYVVQGVFPFPLKNEPGAGQPVPLRQN
jgi:hypothetical protein